MRRGGQHVEADCGPRAIIPIGVGLLLRSASEAIIYTFRTTRERPVLPAADAETIAVEIDGSVVRSILPAPPQPTHLGRHTRGQFGPPPKPWIFKLQASGDALLVNQPGATGYVELFDTFHFWQSAPPLKSVDIHGGELTADESKRHILTIRDAQAGTTKSYYTFGPLWVNKAGAHTVGMLTFNYSLPRRR